MENLLFNLEPTHSVPEIPCLITIDATPYLIIYDVQKEGFTRINLHNGKMEGEFMETNVTKDYIDALREGFMGRIHFYQYNLVSVPHETMRNLNVKFLRGAEKRLAEKYSG